METVAILITESKSRVYNPETLRLQQSPNLGKKFLYQASPSFGESDTRFLSDSIETRMEN
ncbi:hypothetical protein CH361_03075 [Leptospira brenneri]|nr:hypothetical protein CH361_03075 [Leptospira brenneri]